MIGVAQALMILVNLINNGLFDAAARVSQMIAQRRQNNEPMQREDFETAIGNSDAGMAQLEAAIAAAPPDEQHPAVDR